MLILVIVLLISLIIRSMFLLLLLLYGTVVGAGYWARGPGSFTTSPFSQSFFAPWPGGGLGFAVFLVGFLGFQTGAEGFSLGLD